jgi:ABC-2 type transport system ATP-binding protein
LRVVLGDLKPREGQVSYPALSKDPNDWIGIKDQIAFISQFTERWHGKLRNNLTFAAAVYGRTGKENDELVDWYLQRYGLVDYEDATWEVISGGYRTRFDLVRALLSQPRLLVLDEPLAYLDIVTQQVFLSDLRTIASSLQRPIPVIITSQHLYEIEAIADQLIILDNGKCLFSGYVDQISRDFEHKIYEITVKARKIELIEALNSIGLEDIEATMTGHILTFPKEIASKVIFDTLSEAFGERLIYFRNITRSTRSLFRNRRDDIIKDD